MADGLILLRKRLETAKRGQSGECRAVGAPSAAIAEFALFAGDLWLSVRWDILASSTVPLLRLVERCDIVDT